MISESGNNVAAATKNAAEEMSPGILNEPPVKRAGPLSATERSSFAYRNAEAVEEAFGVVA